VDTLDTLRAVPLFEGIPEKHLKSLANWTTTREYAAGQPIVSEGQTGLGLYCIRSGSVRVSKAGADGDRELRTMGPGESFGELALLDDKPRSATVTAVEPTVAVLLDKSQFDAELRSHPEIVLPILQTVVGWLREADARAAQRS
jgi:CRP/FNR family transcriptional regulator, cyclic AMP receptor protein